MPLMVTVCAFVFFVPLMLTLCAFNVDFVCL